jgi:hypothetical protein
MCTREYSLEVLRCPVRRGHGGACAQRGPWSSRWSSRSAGEPSTVALSVDTALPEVSWSSPFGDRSEPPGAFPIAGKCCGQRQPIGHPTHRCAHGHLLPRFRFPNGATAFRSTTVSTIPPGHTPCDRLLEREESKPCTSPGMVVERTALVTRCSVMNGHGYRFVPAGFMRLMITVGCVSPGVRWCRVIRACGRAEQR